MREILFRGKDKDDHKWYTGTYFPYTITTFCYAEDYAAHPNNTKHYIVFDRMTDWGLPNQHLRAEVIPETVGQYTGLKDKNGKQIFEGDICRFREWKNGEMCWVGYVHYENQQFMISGYRNEECISEFCLVMSRFIPENIEVIGNIHDNPELLEVKG